MSNNYIEHEVVKDGWKLQVVQDDASDAENPYHECACLSDCVSWLRNYDLNSTKRPGTTYQGLARISYFAPYDSPAEVVAAYERGELVYYAPLYAYIHSGITVNLGCSSYPSNDVWDSGIAGMIYVTKEKAAKEFPRYSGRTLWLACARVAKAEVKMLDDWLTGNIWGYRITDPMGEEVDSCWGFLGDSEYCLAEAQSSLDYYLAKDAERLAEQSQGALEQLYELPLFKEVCYYG